MKSQALCDCYSSPTRLSFYHDRQLDIVDRDSGTTLYSVPLEDGVDLKYSDQLSWFQNVHLTERGPILQLNNKVYVLQGTKVLPLIEIPDCQEPGYGRVCSLGLDHIVCTNERKLFDLDLRTMALTERSWPHVPDLDVDLVSEVGLFDYAENAFLYLQCGEEAFFFNITKAPALVFSGKGTLEAAVNGRIAFGGSVYEIVIENSQPQFKLCYKPDNNSERAKIVPTANGLCVRFPGEQDQDFLTYVKTISSESAKRNKQIPEMQIEINEFGRSTHFEKLLRGEESEAERECAKIAEIAWLTEFSLRRLQ